MTKRAGAVRKFGRLYSYVNQRKKMEKCKCCDSNLTVKQEEVYGCDVCKSEIDLNKPDNDYLEQIGRAHV